MPNAVIPVSTGQPADSQLQVAATRARVPETLIAADVTLIKSGEIRSEPGLMTDDVLRQAIGFSLFRRSDSRTCVTSSK